MTSAPPSDSPGARSCLFGVLALVAAVLLGAGSAHAATSQTLYGGFDADGTISLTYADGTSIGTPSPPGTLIPAGTYTIVVNNNSPDDLGNPHEFELSGPGVNLLAGQATQLTWTVTFQQASTYVYEDALNPTTQFEVFGTPGSGAGTATTTTANAAQPVAGSAPASSSSSASGTKSSPTDNSPLGTALTTMPFRGTLSGTVNADGKLVLLWKGKHVTTLTAGRYTVRVTDASAKNGFVLQEIHEPAITVTGVKFVGKRTLSVDLSAGQWFFYPTFVGAKTYFIVIR
jgi:hypothetical protein